MADEDRGTIVASGDNAYKPPEDAPESSPLSAVPDQEPDDSSHPKVDQLPDTSASSMAEQETRTTPTRKGSKKATSKKRVVVKKTARKSKWNADNILTDPKSPLASADLRVWPTAVQTTMNLSADEYRAYCQILWPGIF
jgi:hypothetical protein